MNTDEHGSRWVGRGVGAVCEVRERRPEGPSVRFLIVAGDRFAGTEWPALQAYSLFRLAIPGPMALAGGTTGPLGRMLRLERFLPRDREGEDPAEPRRFQDRVQSVLGTLCSLVCRESGRGSEAVVGRFCHRRGSAGASPSRAGVPRSRVLRRAARSFIRGLTPPARLALCEERALSTRWGDALRELVFWSHRHTLLFLQRPRGDRRDCNVVVERALRKSGGR